MGLLTLYDMHYAIDNSHKALKVPFVFCLAGFKINILPFKGKRGEHATFESSALAYLANERADGLPYYYEVNFDVEAICSWLSNHFVNCSICAY